MAKLSPYPIGSIKGIFEIISVLYLWVLVTVSGFADIGLSCFAIQQIVVNFYEAFYA